ncbi:MAG: hypothetical protein LBT46_15450 [Planctomycetaceae bacterium]|jgi:hypothetical protein|nr:hypothetical protein [Planctomycetaceae bacterium]
MSIFTTLWKLPTYVSYAWKAYAVHAVIKEAAASFPSESIALGDLAPLRIWLDKYTPVLAQWAVWTPTAIDDQAVVVLRLLIQEYWTVIEKAVVLLRLGADWNVQELAESVQDTHDRLLAGSSSEVEVGDALTVILLVLTSIRTLLEVRRARREGQQTVPPAVTPEVSPETDGEASPAPVRRRPVADLLKRIFSN